MHRTLQMLLLNRYACRSDPRSGSCNGETINVCVSSLLDPALLSTALTELIWVISAATTATELDTDQRGTRKQSNICLYSCNTYWPKRAKISQIMHFGMKQTQKRNYEWCNDYMNGAMII